MATITPPKKNHRSEVLDIAVHPKFGDILFVLLGSNRYPVAYKNGQIIPLSADDVQECAKTCNAVKHWGYPLTFLEPKGQEETKAEILHLIAESPYMASKKAAAEKLRKKTAPTEAEKEEARRTVLTHIHRLIEDEHRYADAFTLAEVYGIMPREVRDMIVETVTGGVEFIAKATVRPY